MSSTPAAVRRACPPASVIAALAVVVTGSLIAGATAVAGLLDGTGRTASHVEVLFEAVIGSGAFFVSTLRRHRWPWGAVVVGGILAAWYAMILLTVATLDDVAQSRSMVAAMAGIGGAAALLSVAYLRRPVRAWHGYECLRCGAFRWPMLSPAARSSCRRCGAPAPEPV